MADMTQEREALILETAIKVYGPEAQAIVAIEECSELQRALTKWLRLCDASRKGAFRLDPKEAIPNILEEMADVSIMLNQLSLIFGDCNEQEIAKLERLEARVCKTNGAANV